MTGYYLEMWGWNLYSIDAEYLYLRIIGDSVCSTTLSGYYVPENLLDTIESHNLSNEILLMQAEYSTGVGNVYIKILN